MGRSFYYGPNGEARVFDDAEAPDDWKDHPPKEQAAPEDRRPSRVELMAALRARGVQYAPNAGGAELAALLAASTPQAVKVDSNGTALDLKAPDMAALRAEYLAKKGKKPFMGWDESTLREKLAEPE